MKSKKYYVGSCTECGKITVIEINFLEFENDCCLDFKNLKVLKTFNDELEARNYAKLYSKDEEL